MSDPYLWTKLIHILSATLLFGTGLGTAFHLFATHRRGNVVAISVAARNTVQADWLFTAVAAVLQPLTGFMLVYQAGYSPFESWLVITYILYGIAGLCWLKVVQLQYRIRREAVRAAEKSEPLNSDYHRAIKVWFVLGWPAFVGLLVVFMMMVMKPNLW